ncbi:MAG: rod shape-determining protein [Armatimonadota bacterium]
MFGLVDDLGIDLGTSNIVVFARSRGIVLREPSVVAIDSTSQRVMAVGEEARLMLGRTPAAIVAKRPLRDGVIGDYTITREMLGHLIHKTCGRRSKLFRPLVVVSIPSQATSVERRAALDAAVAGGARRAFAIEEPMAAAIGAGLPIAMPGGNMVVDVGGGTSEIAVISLGGIVVSDAVRLGGNRMDEAITRHIKRVYNLAVGERTAEEIKITVGSAYPLDSEVTTEVRGRDLVTGLPRTVTVSSTEVREALAEPVAAIVERVKSVLEETPPELAADIIERGITLTGGGGLLVGLDRLLELETGIPVHVTDDPMSSVATGTGKALEELDVLKRSMAGRGRRR